MIWFATLFGADPIDAGVDPGVDVAPAPSDATEWVGPERPEPAPPPEPPPVSPVALPAMPPTGVGGAVRLTGVAVAAALVATALRAASARLLPTGWLPSAARLVEVLARGVWVVAGAGAVLSLVPAPLEPLVPWVGVATALAVGWSARDVLPDLVAWGFLTAEGRLRPGAWVRSASFEGVILSSRPRTLWLVDRHGRRTGIPNRMVAREPLTTDPNGHPEVVVELVLPGVDPTAARATLVHAALSSPWLAPGTPVSVDARPGVDGGWTVRVRVIDIRFADRFAGTFPERVTEAVPGTSSVTL